MLLGLSRLTLMTRYLNLRMLSSLLMLQASQNILIDPWLRCVGPFLKKPFSLCLKEIISFKHWIYWLKVKRERTNKFMSNLILFLPLVPLQAVGEVVLQLHAGLPLTGIELVNWFMTNKSFHYRPLPEFYDLRRILRCQDTAIWKENWDQAMLCVVHLLFLSLNQLFFSVVSCGNPIYVVYYMQTTKITEWCLFFWIPLPRLGMHD